MKFADQIKRLRENLVGKEGLIRDLKAENLKLNRETQAIKRVLKVPSDQPVRKAVARKRVQPARKVQPDKKKAKK